MKLSRICGLFGACLFGVTSVSLAQSVATTPVGVVNLTVPTNVYTFISIPLYREPVFQGAVLSIDPGGTVLNFEATGLVLDATARVTIDGEQLPTHFLEILDGTDAGSEIPVIGNTATSIAVTEDVSAFVQPGTRVKLRPYHTFGSALPNGGGLGGSHTPATADQVFLVRPGEPARIAFYNIGHNQWRIGSLDITNMPIRSNQGLYVMRRGSSPATLQFTGEVKTGPTASEIYSGYTIIGNPYPIDVSLTSLLADGFETNASQASADQVIIYDSVGNPSIFHHNGTTWLEDNQVVAGDITVPGGGSVFIHRQHPRGPFAWVVDQPFDLN